MAQFIALLKRDYDRFPEAEFGPLLEPEAEQARRMYADGVVRQAWGRKDCAGACLLIEAADEAAARAAVGSLPLFAKGMLILEILSELGPYRGFMPRT